MNQSSNFLIFFDASCLVAAVRSPAGGSGLILNQCRLGVLKLVASTEVLGEAGRNIDKKLGAEFLRRFHEVIDDASPIAAPVPPDAAARYPAINAKDTHVYAAACVARVPFLLTLDRGLLAEANALPGALRALTPGEYIAEVLPGILGPRPR